MRATLLYRIASVLLLLFALGHTVGFLKFKPPTAEGVAVRDAMTNVHFQVSGRDYTYGGFYRGFWALQFRVSGFGRRAGLAIGHACRY